MSSGRRGPLPSLPSSTRRTSTQANEEIAQRAVQEIAECNRASSKIQCWFRAELQRRHFSRVFKRLISRLQGWVRTHFIRKRYLTLVQRRSQWKEFLRPNEAVILESPVMKTSNVRNVRNVPLMRNLLASKKQRQLILTTGDGVAPPRLFYVDPSTRTWKGEIEYDLQLISVLSLSEKEFIIFSKQNEDKTDKAPVWDFVLQPSSEQQGLDWVRAMRTPVSVMDFVLTCPSLTSRKSCSSPASPLKKKTLVNKLRLPVVNDSTVEGPLLMRQFTGPKKYLQYTFALQGTNLVWRQANETAFTGGLTLTPTCRVRLLETPRVVPNLPSIAFWLYIPHRAKPLKFRTLDLSTAQEWVEAIGLCIAKTEVQTYHKRDASAIAQGILQQGKQLFAERSFLSAKIKFKDALDVSPASPEITFDCLEFRSRCNFMLGLYEKALNDCDAALEFCPVNESCLRTRAACLERLNQFAESLAVYDSLLAEFPESTNDLLEVRDRVFGNYERFKTSRNTSLKDLSANAISSKRPAIARQNSQSHAETEINSGLLLFDAKKRPSQDEQLEGRRNNRGSSSESSTRLASSPMSSPITRQHSFTARSEQDLATSISKRLSFRDQM